VGEDPERVKGGHCLVKWRVCTWPKNWGGEGVIGIKDIERFGRALRLRWLWNCWDVVDRPWKNLLKIYDKRYMALFFASTVITVNNGMNVMGSQAVEWSLSQGFGPKSFQASQGQI
jgi:hypothetical protein